MQGQQEMAQDSICRKLLTGENGATSCFQQCQGHPDYNICMGNCLGECDVDGWRACCEYCNKGNQT